MAKTTTNPFTQTIRNPLVNLATSDGAISGGLSSTSILNTKLFLSAGSDGSVVKAISITSDDSVARNVAFYLNTDGGTSRYLIGTVNVPINSGYTGISVNVDALNNTYLIGLTLDQTGRQILPLAAGASISVGVTTAITALKGIHIIGVVEDF